jgi:ABC-type multidrug transport system permease subunit
MPPVGWLRAHPAGRGNMQGKQRRSPGRNVIRPDIPATFVYIAENGFGWIDARTRERIPSMEKRQASPYESPKTVLTTENKLEGLGGWLILVGLMIVMTPLRMSVNLYPVYSKIFSDGSWELLTTPGSPVYSPLWGPVLIGEIAINGALLFAWIFVAFLFFSKRKSFPKWLVGMLFFSLAFILVDALVVKGMLPDEPLFDAETTLESCRSLVGILIWVPYMRMSKRVKATFVR